MNAKRNELYSIFSNLSKTFMFQDIVMFLYFIVNILNGSLWLWNIPKLPLIEDLIYSKISKKYELHDIERDVLIRNVKLLRKI